MRICIILFLTFTVQIVSAEKEARRRTSLTQPALKKSNSLLNINLHYVDAPASRRRSSTTEDFTAETGSISRQCDAARITSPPPSPLQSEGTPANKSPAEPSAQPEAPQPATPTSRRPPPLPSVPSPAEPRHRYKKPLPKVPPESVDGEIYYYSCCYSLY